MKPTESDIAMMRAEAALLAAQAALKGKAKLPEGTTKTEFAYEQMTYSLVQFKRALDLDRKSTHDTFNTIKEVIASQFPDEEDRRRFLATLKRRLEG